MGTLSLDLPLQGDTARSLRAGDVVTLSGALYTARDAAHKRLVALIDQGLPLPFDLNGQTIYYVGPAPASPGHAVGSAGPTSSYRMDPYTVRLLDRGLRGMIGKGLRSREVIEAMHRCGAVYFGATGGAAALIARCIKKSEVVAWPDLGTEAVHRFEVEGFPAVVLIDSEMNSLYESGPLLYKGRRL